MRVCIHRGTHEIGGTCIEIESQSKRIVLDIGLPLESELSDTPLPPVSGFRGFDSSLLGVFISHPHLDHYGLAPKLLQEIPVLIGSAALRILKKRGSKKGVKSTLDSSMRQDRSNVDLTPCLLSVVHVTPQSTLWTQKIIGAMTRPSVISNLVVVNQPLREL